MKGWGTESNGSSRGAALFCSWQGCVSHRGYRTFTVFSCILSKLITSVGDSWASEPPECHNFLLFSHFSSHTDHSEPPPRHFSFLIVSALQRKCHLCISFLGIARPLPKFPHSCVCEQFIYSQDRSTYFLQQKRQTHRGNI
jgi:hypothetical protein